MAFRSFELLNLIKDFGENLTLSKITTAGAYNPATGAVDNSQVTNYAILAYLYDYNSGVIGGNDEVIRGTRKCVISASGLAALPDFDDLIIGSNGTVKIISVTSIFSGGTAMGYICNVAE
jgi:hypothetical protein|tara:strand:+ start:203 stop:562 length:360 start_codon:yes stop_codon:yes gene_type:complete